MIIRAFLSRSSDKGPASPLPTSLPSSRTQSPAPMATEKQVSVKGRPLLPSFDSAPTSRARVVNPTLNSSSSTISNGSAKGRLIVSEMPSVDDGDGRTYFVLTDSTRAKLFNIPKLPSRLAKANRIVYEIKPTAQMGSGMFAKSDIKRGDLILRERPLLLVPSVLPGILLKRPDHLTFTPQQEARAYMMEFEMLLSNVFKRMDQEDQESFTTLENYHRYGGDGMGPLFGIFRTNAIHIDELQDDSIPQALQQHSVICRTGARINHSCMPNVGIEFDAQSFSIKFKATRNIEAGEQLFSSYTRMTRDVVSRRAILQSYGIECHCRACLGATPESDRVRKTFVGKIQKYTEYMTLDPSTPRDTKKLTTSLSEMHWLENAMVKEGIDGHPLFEGLLVAICCIFAMLGNKPQARKYYRDNIDIFDRRSDAKTWRAWYELM